MLPLFLPVAVATMAGDTIAGEAQSGTLRYLLTRPVGRTKLLVAKLVSVFAFVIVAVVVVAAIGFLVGRLLLGNTTLSGTASAAVASVSGSPLTPGQIALRTALTILYVAFSMLGVAAMAMMLSTFVDSPLTATLGALAFLIGSSLLLTLDAAHSFTPYLPTRYWFVVHRSVPQSDPVAKRGSRSSDPARLCGGVRRYRLGELQHQGRHLLTVEPDGEPD